MCLLLLLHRIHPDFPIVVAANRDEYYDRPSLPPERSADGAVLAPRDARAGGTWIGVNRHGVFAGITNRSATPYDPHRPSRGGVCRAALEAPDVPSAERAVLEIVRRAPPNGFNLMLADRERASAIHFEGDRAGDAAAALKPLDPGLHVLTNFHDVDRLFLREIAERFEARLGSASSRSADHLLAELREIVRDHTVRTPEDHAICKHFEKRGTVSSSLVLVPASPRARGRFLFCDGPPCRNEFRDVSALWPEPSGK